MADNLRVPYGLSNKAIFRKVKCVSALNFPEKPKQNKFMMDGWLLASPYSSYGSLAVLYREASGSYG